MITYMLYSMYMHDHAWSCMNKIKYVRCFHMLCARLQLFHNRVSFQLYFLEAQFVTCCNRIGAFFLILRNKQDTTHANKNYHVAIQWEATSNNYETMTHMTNNDILKYVDIVTLHLHTHARCQTHANNELGTMRETVPGIFFLHKKMDTNSDQWP